MKTVYKYGLLPQIGQRQSIAMPAGCDVIKAALQDGKFTLWALVNTTRSLETRYFVIHGTGHEITDTLWCHVDTIFDGPLVWHVFELSC